MLVITTLLNSPIQSTTYNYIDLLSIPLACAPAPIRLLAKVILSRGFESDDTFPAFVSQGTSRQLCKACSGHGRPYRGLQNSRACVLKQRLLGVV